MKQHVIGLADPYTLRVICPKESSGIVKKVGGIWDKSSFCWFVVFTVYNLEFLLDRFPQGCRISPRIEEILPSRIEQEDRLFLIVKDSKDDKTARLKVPYVKIPLYHYQKYGVMFAVNGFGGVLIGDSMGLGKSLQAIGTACWKKKHDNIDNCLIIAKNSLKYNWKNEIEKFTDMNCVIIDGKPENREEQWKRDDVFFYIVNYELVLEDLFGGKEIREPKEPDKIKRTDSSDIVNKKQKKIDDYELKMVKYRNRKAKVDKRNQNLADIRAKKWGMIVVDEVHNISNLDTKRSECIGSLNTGFKMGLTGTPLDGKLEGLYGVMEFVYPGLFGTKYSFLKEYAVTDYWGTIIGYKNVEQVKKRMEPFFIRRLKEEVQKQLPEKNYSLVYVDLSGKERKLYDRLKKGDHELTEESQDVVKVMRCRQVCNHPALIEEEVESSKMDALRDLVDEVVVANLYKVIIFTQFKKMIPYIQEMLDDLGVSNCVISGGVSSKKRDEVEKEFNKKKGKDVIIGTDAMSEGLNLTAASYVINYDDPWSPSIMKQRGDRAHRVGQDKNVTIVNFVCRDTVEERVREVVYGKDDITSRTLDEDGMGDINVNVLTTDQIMELL